jgi:predicted dehydrogenase
MQAGKDVLIELPLATSLDDANRIVAAQEASGRRAFIDMFSRFSPANLQLRQAAATSAMDRSNPSRSKGAQRCSGQGMNSPSRPWRST